MTATAEVPPSAENLSSLAGPLYRSPWASVPDFQIELAAWAALVKSGMIVADAGLGKSHIGMMLAAFLFEERESDLVLLVAEQNKIREWHEDFRSCTPLIAGLYYGPGRHKKLVPETQVLISTYETARNDVVRFSKPRGQGSKSPGPLMTFLAGRRVTVIYDEVSKLRSRSSALYKAHYWMAGQLRKQGGTRIVGMTATPLERDWEDAFSELRALTEGMPTVAEFEKRLVLYRDDYRRPHWRPEGIPWFLGICEPRMRRKRKTDPDVASQFPDKVEEVRVIPLAKEQQKLYELVSGLAFDEDEQYQDIPGLWTILCQIAGHPASVLRGKSRIAAFIRETIGEERLLAAPSAKADRLTEDLELLIRGQGAKVVVFTRWGQSVLPVLEERLRKLQFAVFSVHGGLTSAAQHDARQAFRNWRDPAVLLASDAGSRGVNIPEASYIIEYEGTSHARHIQRMDRAHRIGTATDGQGARRLLTCWTYLAEASVEEGLARRRLERNEQHDLLLGDLLDENSITASDRRAMIEAGRGRRRC